MKTKVILFIGAVAVVTLSFTFASVDNPSPKVESLTTNTISNGQVGGFISDTVVK